MNRRRIYIAPAIPRQREHGAQSFRKWNPTMVCNICGERIRQWQAWSFDHEVPISRGGRRGKINKKPAHLLCNSVKGDAWPFSLRTPVEREAIRGVVHPRTYDRLVQVWSGG